jgi:hypothetical protein
MEKVFAKKKTTNFTKQKKIKFKKRVFLQLWHQEFNLLEREFQLKVFCQKSQNFNKPNLSTQIQNSSKNSVVKIHQLSLKTVYFCQK